MSSAALEVDTATGPFYGRIGYVTPAGNGALLALDRDGLVVVPHTNWRGLFDAGTDTLGQACCSTIDWIAKNYGAYLDGHQLASPSGWGGSLVTGGQDQSGLQYMQNRYYDPATGRFTQADPIGLAGGINAYGYASGDPVNYSDPTGLKTDDCTIMATTCGSYGWSDENAAAMAAAATNPDAGGDGGAASCPDPGVSVMGQVDVTVVFGKGVTGDLGIYFNPKTGAAGVFVQGGPMFGVGGSIGVGGGVGHPPKGVSARECVGGLGSELCMDLPPQDGSLTFGRGFVETTESPISTYAGPVWSKTIACSSSIFPKWVQDFINKYLPSVP